MLWRQCSTSTSARALASTGVPTANASSARSDRLSCGDGHDDHRRGFERVQPFLVGQHAGEPHVRVVRQRHQLDAHQHERRVAAFLDVVLEVFEQLFAALARIDAAAVERERPVDAMAAAEARRALEVRRSSAASRRHRLGGVRARRSVPLALVVLVDLRLRHVDAAADRLLDDGADENCVVTNRRSTSVFQTMPAGALNTSL